LLGLSFLFSYRLWRRVVHVAKKEKKVLHPAETEDMAICDNAIASPVHPSAHRSDLIWEKIERTAVFNLNPDRIVFGKEAFWRC